MKRIIYLFPFVLILFSVKVRAQQEKKQWNNYTFYLVRHAEKDTGNNPALKPEGFIRAGDLYRRLKNEGIRGILVSQYKRSQLTSDSLRIYSGTDTFCYKTDLSGDNIMSVISTKCNKPAVLLIIGHNNTIPVIIRKLGVTGFDLTEIPDNEYDNIYKVVIRKNKARLFIMKYGKPSPAGDKSIMKPLQ